MCEAKSFKRAGNVFFKGFNRLSFILKGKGGKSFVISRFQAFDPGWVFSKHFIIQTPILST